MTRLDFKKFRLVCHAFCWRPTTSLGWPACRQALELAVGGQRADFMHKILAPKASGITFFANCKSENSTDLVFLFCLSFLSNGSQDRLPSPFLSKRYPRNGVHALSDETSVVSIIVLERSWPGHHSHTPAFERICTSNVSPQTLRGFISGNIFSTTDEASQSLGWNVWGAEVFKGWCKGILLVKVSGALRIK